MRKLAATLAAAALLAAAPTASAQGFREPDVRAALEANGLGALAGTVAPAARPVLILDRTLRAREPRELGTTRLGGRPDLPAGTKWPRCHGYAQTFPRPAATARPAGGPRACRTRRHAAVLRPRRPSGRKLEPAVHR